MPRGCYGCFGCVGCLCVSDTAQVELRSGRVSAPAARRGLNQHCLLSALSGRDRGTGPGDGAAAPGDGAGGRGRGAGGRCGGRRASERHFPSRGALPKAGELAPGRRVTDENKKHSNR
jgi:hypothetical protein